MRDDRLRLLDIIEAIERIEQYASQGYAAFNNQEANWGKSAEKIKNGH